jgi:hypothetical protein
MSGLTFPPTPPRRPEGLGDIPLPTPRPEGIGEVQGPSYAEYYQATVGEPGYSGEAGKILENSNTLTTNSAGAGRGSVVEEPGARAAAAEAEDGTNSQTQSSTSTGLPSSSYTGLSNVLHQFTSYNYLITLCALSPSQKNTPDQQYYKKGAAGLKYVIARSAGNWGKSNRAITSFGQFDYFIDDLNIFSAISFTEGTGVTTGLRMSFKVTEPYSMGLFLETMQQASYQAGNRGPYQYADYLLVIEFIGYMGDVPTTPGETAAITKYIPINIMNASMKVTNAGSVYECNATTSNQRAFGKTFGNTHNEVKLSGDNVAEVLTGSGDSLLTHFKKQFEKEKADNKLNAIDSINIVFPSDFSQPGDSGNAIKNSKIFTDFSDNGTVPMPNNSAVWDPNTKIYNNKKITISEKKNFHFKKDTKIEEIITEIILRSKYCSDQVIPELKTDNSGMLNWFRIESQVRDGAYIEKLNRHAQKIDYRIVPYKVHASKFTPPNVQPPGYAELKAQAAKVYNYIFTGKNTDIINLDLTFKMAYLATQPSDLTNRSGVDNRGQSGIEGGQKETNVVTAAPPGPPKITEPTVPVVSTGDSSEVYGTTAGGSGSDSKATKQVRTFHQRILDSNDTLLKIDLEILGDPYFLPDSGLGNQLVPPRSLNVLNDGSMNYQGGQVDFIVNFNTPIDIDTASGLYKFGKPIDQFSGLYEVLRVESKFVQGKFTQIIAGTRRPQQIEGSIAKTSSFQSSGKDTTN